MDNCSQIIDNSDYLMPNIPLRSSDKIKPGFRSSPNITSGKMLNNHFKN